MALNGRGVALDLYDSYEDILESHKTTHFLSGKRRGRILLQRVIFPQWSPSDLDHCDQRSVLSLPLSITGHYCLQMAGMVFGWHSLRIWCFDSVAPTSGIMMGTVLTINFPRIYRTMATPRQTGTDWTRQTIRGNRKSSTWDLIFHRLHHSHRLHFPGHRHTRSKEETSKPSLKDSSQRQDQ
jgi:hypothetical protein